MTAQSIATTNCAVIDRAYSQQLLLSLLFVLFVFSSCTSQHNVNGIPLDVYVQSLHAEDTRLWDASTIGPLLMDANPQIRARAAVAAGRIGDIAVIPGLAELLRPDSDENVALAAAF